ncbi:MAG: hypothetical protein V3U74_02775 [Thermodesulfobacteriota bacterium]
MSCPLAFLCSPSIFKRDRLSENDEQIFFKTIKQHGRIQCAEYQQIFVSTAMPEDAWAAVLSVASCLFASDLRTPKLCILKIPPSASSTRTQTDTACTSTVQLLDAIFGKKGPVFADNTTAILTSCFRWLSTRGMTLVDLIKKSVKTHLPEEMWVTVPEQTEET